MDPDLAGLDPAPLRDILAGGPAPLFATVSGAHLYGFQSPDSDVDLRGAFVAPLDRVLRISPYQETLIVERMEVPRRSGPARPRPGSPRGGHGPGLRGLRAAG